MPDVETAADADVAEVVARRAVLLPVGKDWHALEMAWVREVVAAPLLTALPTAPHSVVGVFNLRGEIVPLFHLAALMGLGSERDTSFAVVVESEYGLAGFAATGVPESVELGVVLGATETEGTLGSFAIGTRIATLLDPDALLAPERVGGWAS